MKLAATAMIAVLVWGATHGANAEPAPEDLTLSYLYDGGAVPFFWLPLVGAFAIDRWVEPRKTPLYFRLDDGGQPRSTWQNPSWSLYVGGAALAASMIGRGDEARWYHVKGLSQALATSSLVVSILKPTFGRRRPDWTKETLRSDVKSFPSGHTTGAFVVATYAALYLHGRVFDDHSSVLAQSAAYSGIFLGASLFAGERIFNARHHLSDVLAGALIGSASSYAMFRFQDHRFRHRNSEIHDDGGIQIAPSFTQEAITLGLSGEF